MRSAWEEIDEWGPEKVLQVYDPDTGMKGVLVIDNTSKGPGKGKEVSDLLRVLRH